MSTNKLQVNVFLGEEIRKIECKVLEIILPTFKGLSEQEARDKVSLFHLFPLFQFMLYLVTATNQALTRPFHQCHGEVSS